MAVRVACELGLPPAEAFTVLTDEVSAALARAGVRLEAGVGGRVTLAGARDGEGEVGRVLAWEPGHRVVLRWHPTDWDASAVTEMVLTLEPYQGGTRATLEHRGLEPVVDDEVEMAAWFAGEVAASLLLASTPERFGDWLTDRLARRPAGVRARRIYREPVHHYPNFRAILQELDPQPEDHLLEVGCGGGAFLKEALERGCRASAVDHSAAMVALAREENAESVAQGRLDVRQASADALPFEDESFTCAAMTGVLGFLPDPVAALREIRRVLKDGGRLVVFGSDPSQRGTPAAPEPMASRLRFYSDEELARLGHAAGFSDARVLRRDLAVHAREAGLSEDVVAAFAGWAAPFLVAHKR
ncbi:MAG TPA: methyltransferase domain-containing protein [Trueperaceae bacterium]|nr:methyltransferase domain-containing protein [Trueperaceae bacterium]